MTYAKRKMGKRIRPDFKPWQSVEFIGWRKGKDNRGYYNTSGNPCNNRNSMRIPPLKASDKIWNGFYRLFPYVKRFLMGDRTAWYDLRRSDVRREYESVYCTQGAQYRNPLHAYAEAQEKLVTPAIRLSRLIRIFA